MAKATAKRKGTEVVPAKSNLPVLSNWRERVRANVGAALQKGVGTETGGTLSFATGSIEYKDNDLGHEIDVVILGAVPARAYYEGAYDPSSKEAPTCYSNDGEKPDATITSPQNDACATCPLNAFGSAKSDGKGEARGKGCKEGYKVALIHADALDKGTYDKTEIVTAKFSVTASKVVAKYLRGTDGIPFTHVTSLVVKPDKKTKYAVLLEQGAEIDEPVQDVLGSRIDEVEAVLKQPYPAPDPSKAKAPKQRGKVTRRRAA